MGAQIGGYHTFYLGATAPQGLFKVLVRIRDRSGTAAKHRWGLGYVFGDVTAAPSAAVSGDWVNPSALNVWEVLDLGQLLIPPISTPTGETLPDYNLRIYQGHSDTIETVYFDLDFVFLLPMDEAVAIIDAVPAAQKLLLDTQSDVPSVYLTDASDVVQSRPDYLGTAPLLGQENTRIYILRDDAIAVAFTFDPNYIPRYMVV